MIYLIEVFRWPLLSALLLGAWTGWSGRRSAEGARTGGGGRLARRVWLGLAVLLLLAGLAASVLQLLDGRAALALDSFVLFLGTYLIGAALGLVLTRRRAPALAKKPETARVEPKLGEGESGEVSSEGRVEPKISAERQGLRPLPSQALGLRAPPLPPPMPMPAAAPLLPPLVAARLAKARRARAAVATLDPAEPKRPSRAKRADKLL